MREVAENSASVALQKGHEFVFECGEKSLQIRGYPRLFGEAVANLIDNAIRHTPSGTQITVGLENGEGDGSACVYVADDRALIDEHAERSGFPATVVTEVSKIIDPTTAKG